jgi:hypothetical protein
VALALRHSSKQPPQLLGSLLVSTQALPQSVSPDAQPQLPWLQTPPVGQAWPQLPQLLASDWVSTQVWLLAQKVGVSAGQEQPPPTQLWAAGHEVPPWPAQPPQSAELVSGSTQVDPPPPEELLELEPAATHWFATQTPGEQQSLGTWQGYGVPEVLTRLQVQTPLPPSGTLQ